MQRKRRQKARSLILYILYTIEKASLERLCFREATHVPRFKIKLARRETPDAVPGLGVATCRGSSPGSVAPRSSNEQLHGASAPTHLCWSRRLRPGGQSPHRRRPLPDAIPSTQAAEAAGARRARARGHGCAAPGRRDGAAVGARLPFSEMARRWVVAILRAW